MFCINHAKTSTFFSDQPTTQKKNKIENILQIGFAGRRPTKACENGKDVVSNLQISQRLMIGNI